MQNDEKPINILDTISDDLLDEDEKRYFLWFNGNEFDQRMQGLYESKENGFLYDKPKKLQQLIDEIKNSKIEDKDHILEKAEAAFKIAVAERDRRMDVYRTPRQPQSVPDNNGTIFEQPENDDEKQISIDRTVPQGANPTETKDNEEKIEYIPNTDIPKPRGMYPTETEEEYVAFLKDYYEKAFSNVGKEMVVYTPEEKGLVPYGQPQPQPNQPQQGQNGGYDTVPEGKRIIPYTPEEKGLVPYGQPQPGQPQPGQPQPGQPQPVQPQPVQPQPVQPQPQPVDDIEFIDLDVEKLANEYDDDMLDKYFGNKDKHKEFVERINRVHSHIVDKNGYQTIEDYPEIIEDLKFCKIEEYKERLERYSKGEDEYKKIYDQLKKAGFVPPNEKNGQPYTQEEFVIAKQLEDREYIETNNQNYDKHKMTRANLATLGKYGEKQAYAEIEKIRNAEGNIEVMTALKNLAKISTNVMLFVRNNTRVPLSKFIGKNIAVPIHKLIYKDKIASPYSNDRTHRYEERKEYFEQVFDEVYENKLKEKNDKREAKGKTVKKGYGAKYALMKSFGPRFEAMFKIKEGDFAVLDNGRRRNIENAKEKIENENLKKENLTNLALEYNRIIATIKEINVELENTQDPDKIEELQEQKNKLNENLIEIQKTYKIMDQTIGTKQNDAISMQTHEKANRENVTKAVTAAKTIARVAVAKFVTPRIKKTITETITKVTNNPSRLVPKEVKGASVEDIKKITIGDASANGDNLLTYEASQTKHLFSSIKFGKKPLTARGFSVTYKGHRYSLSDISSNLNGTQLTTSGNYTISNNSNLCQVIADTITRGGGPHVTADDIAKEMADAMAKAATPQQGLTQLFGDMDLWATVNGRATGIPDGWQELLEGLTKTMPSTHTVMQVIPGSTIVTTEKVTKEVIRKGMVAVLGVDAASQVADMYEHARRTQSQKEMKKQQMMKEGLKKIKETYPEGPERDAAIAELEKQIDDTVELEVPIQAKTGYEHSVVNTEGAYDKDNVTTQMIEEWKENKSGRSGR